MSSEASMYDALERIFGFIFQHKIVFSFSHDKQQHSGNIAGTCGYWQMFLCIYIHTSKSLYINLRTLAAGRHLLLRYKH